MQIERVLHPARRPETKAVMADTDVSVRMARAAVTRPAFKQYSALGARANKSSFLKEQNMQLQPVLRPAPLLEIEAVIAGSAVCMNTVQAPLTRPAKALGTRVNVVKSKPWLFPLQVTVIFVVLWLQQHGYLNVPITVCDWINISK